MEYSKVDYFGSQPNAECSVFPLKGIHAMTNGGHKTPVKQIPPQNPQQGRLAPQPRNQVKQAKGTV